MDIQKLTVFNFSVPVGKEFKPNTENEFAFSLLHGQLCN